MEKVLKHLKRNAAIYLIALLCLLVVLIVVFHKPQTELETVDTSLFNVVTLNQVKDMFKDSKAKFVVISRSDDQATVKYVPTLQYSIGSAHNKVYYLELDNLKKDEEEELKSLLDIKHLIGQDDVLNQIPLNLIIKNKKVEYAYVGPMNLSTLEALVRAYGVSEENA